MPSFPDRLAFESLTAQQDYAETALRQMLRYIADSSPFYKELFAKHEIDPEAIKNVAGLQTLPFTTKDDMQERNWDFLCVPGSEIKEYTATSGTMGKPVTIALTANDLLRLAYNERQSFLCAGGSPQDLYQLALTLDRQFMAGIAYYSGIRAMGASLVRTGSGLPQMQWETIQRLGTTGLVVVPSFLLEMILWAEQHGLSPGHTRVGKAICIGEAVRRADFSLSALGEQIRQKWDIPLYGTYAATELQTAFTECFAGRGGHHQSELVIVEIVDADGQAVPDGSPGEVVVTTLGLEGMPLLRYRTGDIASLHAEPCSCGRHSKRLGPVIGRKGQMIKYRGTTLYPPALFDMLNGASFITSYVVEVFTGTHATDEVRLHIHTALPVEECNRRLRPLLQSGLRVVPLVQYHSAAAIQQMQMPEGSRKPLRFLDTRKGFR